MFYPMRFKPIYKDCIWGGNGFAKFGRQLPGSVIAESWEISCHEDGASVVDNGRFEGMTLAQLITSFGTAITGEKINKKYAKNFPLLVKLIDANDRLSVQVHPDDAYAFANENGENGKNEMWYIMDAKPGAQLIYDVRPGMTRESLQNAIDNGTMSDCFNMVEVQPGDALYIPAGVVHAIGSGIMIAEVQQSSNATYRLYDYDRVDANGMKRPLHIQKAMDVIDFNCAGRTAKLKPVVRELNGTDTAAVLVESPFFITELMDIRKGFIEEPAGERFYIYTVVEGSGSVSCGSSNVRFGAGDSLLIPAGAGKCSFEGTFKALRAFMPKVK